LKVSSDFEDQTTINTVISDDFSIDKLSFGTSQLLKSDLHSDDLDLDDIDADGIQEYNFQYYSFHNLLSQPYNCKHNI
jgi:hypothetical protein